MSRESRKEKNRKIKSQTAGSTYNYDDEDDEFENYAKPFDPKKAARRERRRKVRVAFLAFLAIVIMAAAAVTCRRRATLSPGSRSRPMTSLCASMRSSVRRTSR